MNVPEEDGCVVTGVPLPQYPLDVTQLRRTASLRCAGCEETFAHLAATGAGPVLIYRPVLWDGDTEVVWFSNDREVVGVPWVLDGGTRPRRAKQRHILDLAKYRAYDQAERVVLACRCPRHPHIGDPHALYRFAVDGGTGVVEGAPPVRRVIPVGRGECIDGNNRLLFAKVQRIRRRMGPEAWADLESRATRLQDDTVASASTRDVP